MAEPRPPGKPRLLVLASTYPRWPCDPEPGFVHELARRLTPQFEVCALSPHAAGAATEDVLDGVQVRRFRYAPAALESLVNDGGIVANLKRHPWKWLLVPGFLIGQAVATARLVRAWRPDAIHAHWLIPQGLLAILAIRLLPGATAIPVVVTSHGADLFALRAAPLQWLKRRVIRAADHLTVVSAAMRQEVLRLWPTPDKVTVQPMGVDFTDRFTTDEGAARSPDEILFVGRLVEKKGLRHLLDAMVPILERRPSAFLTVAGFGPEESSLRQQTRRLGIHERVNFIGPVAQRELPALYRRAAVFVAPFVEAASGDQEGLGLVMVEAIACGCPVVASDLPAVRDVLDSGVPPADPARLAKAILDVLALPPSPPQARALRARAAVRFDWSAVAAGYAAILHRLIGRA